MAPKEEVNEETVSEIVKAYHRWQIEELSKFYVNLWLMIFAVTLLDWLNKKRPST